MRHRKWITLIFSAALLAFTLYAALDTFVLTRVYTPVTVSEALTQSTAAQAENTDAAQSAASDAAAEESAETKSSRRGKKTSSTASAETEGTSSEDSGSTSLLGFGNMSSSAVQTAVSYSDANISVTLTTYRQYDTDIYVADVQLSSAEYLKTAFAQNAYGKNVTDTTSSMAQSSGAILAVNGDYYGARESGYVLRSGVLYRNTAKKGQEDLVIYADGSFEIITETEVSAEELLARGAVQILSFGPGLVADGQIAVTADEEVGRAMASNPRTCIAQVDELHYLFIVSDGRTDSSEGLSLYQQASFAQSLGAKTAYNLDGGGSSAMVFNGELINNPTTNGSSIKERKVSDIVYIGY